MKKIIFVNVLLMLACNLPAQEPVIKVYVYSQRTIPGTPQPGRNEIDTGAQITESPFPVTYFLYAEVTRGTKFSVSGVWIQGKYFTAITKKIATPVILENNIAVMEKKSVLVKKTLNDVFIIQTHETTNNIKQNEKEKALIQDNDVVIVVKANAINCYGIAKKIISLPAAAAM